MAKKKQPEVRKGGGRSRERGASELTFMRQLGAKIKERRVAVGMTADALGRAVGVSITTQFRREAGDQSGQWEDLHRYAKALECKVADLLP